MSAGTEHMERRELLSLGGIAAMAGAFAATEMPAQEGATSGAGKRVLRIYADADGNSQIQELPIATKPGRTRRSETASVTGLSYAEYPSSSVEDWHRTPGRQFSISMSGEIEVEVSGGKKHAIHAGDIVFLEDLQGKGHITRILTPVTNIFIRVADGFDVVAWARGEA
jgi:quercetin dioxygenase-like cupin family protein